MKHTMRYSIVRAACAGLGRTTRGAGPIRTTRLHVAAAVVAAAALSGCAMEAPLGPRDEHATIQLAANATAPSAIGETVLIDAALMDSDGARMPSTQLHWDLSAPGVLEALGGGRFLVLKEGSVQVAAIWPKDPSVRATVTVNVDAGLLAVACITKADQTSTRTSKCAQTRVVVRVAGASALAAELPTQGDRPVGVPVVVKR